MSKLLWTAAAVAFVATAVAGYVHVASPHWASEFGEQEEDEGPPDGDYWAIRASYPTGHFDQRWLVAAGKHERTLASAVPAGIKSYRRSPNSPLSLDPTQFTPLGPMPETNSQFGFGHVSGRINVLRVDPTATVEGSTIVYAGSDGGGIWKTTNCCSPTTTWNVVTDVPEVASMSISDITLDPNDHQTIYAGTGDLNFGSFSFGAAGVLKSTDAGATWALLGADVFAPFYPGSANGFPQYQAVGKVVVDPNDSNKVVAGTKTGLYISYDAGTNWTGPCFTNPYAVPNNPASATAQRQDITGLLAIDAGGGVTKLYAAVGTRGIPTPVQPDLANFGANGVYRAAMPTSGCPAVADWTLLNNSWPAGTGNGVTNTVPIGRIEIAYAPSNPLRMYAEAQDTNTRKINSFYRSDDGGTTWTKSIVNGINTDSSDVGCGDGNSASGGGQMWYDAGLTVDPNNPDRVWMSTIDANVSSDAGANFHDATCGYNGGTGAPTTVHVDHHARAYIGNSSSRFMLGSDGGAFYTTSGDAAVGPNGSTTMQFIQLNDSINSIEFYYGDITANFATSATPAIGAGAQDNGCSWTSFSGSPTAPKLWTANCGGDGTTTRIEPIKGLTWFNSSQNGSLGRSQTGGGGSFASAAASTGGTWGGDNVGAIFAMSYDIYKWGDTGVAGSGCDLTNGCNHMIAGTVRLWETTQSTVASSATMRSSWKARTVNLTKNNLILGTDNRSYINYVAYSFTDPRIAAVGTNDGNVQLVYNLGTAATANCVTPGSDTNCATAVNVTDGNAVLPNRPIQGVRFDPTNANIAYAGLGGFDENSPGHPGHIFQITCSAYLCPTRVWRDKSGNLPNIPVQQVMPNPHRPEQVFVGTDWGIYFTEDIFATTPVWQRFAGFPHVMVWELGVDRGFTTLVAFTRSRGAWVWPLTTSAFSGADVSVAVAGPASTSPGSNVSYTMTITNNGPDTATSVSVDNPTPTGLTFVSTTGDCVTAFPCTFATIAPGVTQTITVTYSVPADYSGADPIVDTVTASATSVDAVGSNNTASASTSIALATDISVTVTPPANVVPGKRATYTLTVSNLGANAATGVQLTSTPPAGTTFASNSGDCTTAFPCSFASIAAGASEVVTTSVCVPRAFATNPVSFTASVTSTTGDTNSGNNSASANAALVTDTLFVDGFDSCP